MSVKRRHFPIPHTHNRERDSGHLLIRFATQYSGRKQRTALRQWCQREEGTVLRNRDELRRARFTLDAMERGCSVRIGGKGREEVIEGWFATRIEDGKGVDGSNSLTDHSQLHGTL